MDYYTKQKVKRLMELYIEGDEGTLVSLTEINPDYQELAPIIKEITNKAIEKKRGEFESKYNTLKETYKEFKTPEEYEILKERLNEIKEKLNNIKKNEKELSDILNKDNTCF